MTASVRLAEPDDADAIFGLVKMLHDENGLFSLSEAKVRQYIQRYYDRKGAIIGVIGDRGALQGSIYLAIDEPYYSDEFQITEAWNIVHPDYRKSDHAKSLITFAKSCSDEIGIPLMIGIISNHRTEAKVRLYERQLEKAGAFFVYNRRLSKGPAWDQPRGNA